MIITTYVGIRWPDGTAPVIGQLAHAVPLRLHITDPRVLLAAHQALSRRLAVSQVDLYSRDPATFVVAQDDRKLVTSTITDMMAKLEEPETVRLCWPEDGGIKTVLADLDFFLRA
jgi:hypothetical protein